MPQPLVDLLWSGHPDAPAGARRGPKSRRSTADVVARAVSLADADGLDAVTVRALAGDLGISTMSVYTYVNSRDDLLVLMADAAHGAMALPAFGRADWRTRVRRVADANLVLLLAHPWLLRIHDDRTALGPGTIAKYDHELQAFGGTGLDDLDRDAALTLVLDFVGAAAARRTAPPVDFGPLWAESAGRLAHYLGDDHPLAQRVGRAAGESMGAPYGADRAWAFGLDRLLAGLADLVD
ncbi:TetR family transcriptional regulator [Nakamurella flava]|uniref:TetR family transcriptional regulator n=1 Tax=Nakamurella flava TaxID=2576308 RepID=A0A4U6QJL5_9ACTN|nr:TetR/AcrR family transcriptional regulator C-terminal domain-containing protein [Nakamurella flava]TKV60633.1 TetR family transcriptional regulator [Nakamurella flava]